jgi:hypothetical protein
MTFGRGALMFILFEQPAAERLRRTIDRHYSPTSWKKLSGPTLELDERFN